MPEYEIDEFEIEEGLNMIEWFEHPELPPEDPWGKETWMIMESDDEIIILI
jgi:hypothetical protein